MIKVVELGKNKKEKLEDFLAQVAEGETRPAVFIGLDKNGEAILYLGDLSWKELAYIKTAFEMHVTRDWLGLMK